MAGFFRRLFGASAKEEGAGLERDVGSAVRDTGLDVQAALMAHMNWKLRLETYLDGRSTEDLRPEVICFDDRCDLGKWIHGPGQQRLGRLPGFADLREKHRMFHYCASNVVSLAQSGKQEEARRLLKGTYENFSQQVCDDLTQLQAIVARRGAR